MTLATSAKGVGLYVKQTGDTWTKFNEVSSVPEIGQAADKIDVTSLDSDMKTYIPDIPDFSSDLEFVMNSIPKGAEGSNLDLVMSLDPETTYDWKIAYPQQGVECTLKAQFVWRMGAGEVSAKQDLMLTLIPRTSPAWVEYTNATTVVYNTLDEETEGSA